MKPPFCLIPFLFVLLFFSGCKQEKNPRVGVDVSGDIDMIEDMTNRLEELSSSQKTIFYGIYSPVQMSKFFETYQVDFDPSVVNPVDASSRYLSTSKVALNLGVYGVDLSYIKMFDQPQDAIEYYLTIGKLSRQLGLPDELIRAPAENYRENLDNPEKLIDIATTTYAATEQFLKQNNLEYAAVLMLAGGWVEAMYIATHAFYGSEMPREMVIERIAAQKYSLNLLITMMQNHASQEAVAYNLHLLNVLKKYFDQFDIYFSGEDTRIDTVNNTIQAERSYIDISNEIIENIKRVITGMREEIIS